MHLISLIAASIGVNFVSWLLVITSLLFKLLILGGGGDEEKPLHSGELIKITFLGEGVEKPLHSGELIKLAFLGGFTGVNH